MNRTYVIALAILVSVGFVPNKRNPRYHRASCTIADYTVWCKDISKARRIRNRVMRALEKRGYYPRWEVKEPEFEGSEYNWK